MDVSGAESQLASVAHATPVMRSSRFQISAGAILAAALIYYFTDSDFWLALLPAVLAHEMGHLGAIKLLGFRVRGFRMEWNGLCIDYTGAGNRAGEIAIAAAGPLAGFLYAGAASRFGSTFHQETALLSAGFSLLLSFFNLLPIRPLDGGQIAEAVCKVLFGAPRGEVFACYMEIAAASALTLAGAWLLWQGRGAGMLLTGVFLFGKQLAR